MKKTLLNTALANMTGALALTIMFGSGMALATEVTLDETLQYNEDSRNVEAEKGSQAADNGSWNESNEAEAENGGQAATNHGKNIDIEIDTETRPSPRPRPTTLRPRWRAVLGRASSKPSIAGIWGVEVALRWSRPAIGSVRATSSRAC